MVRSGVFASIGSSGRSLGDGLNRFKGDKSIRLSGLIALLDIHGEIKVSIRGQWPKAIQHEFVDAKLRKVERVEDGFHELRLVVKEPWEFFSQQAVQSFIVGSSHFQLRLELLYRIPIVKER